MKVALGQLVLLAALLASAAPGSAQGGATYEVISYGPEGLEVRFHGLPMRSVHADDNQNALAIDFLQPVDGTLFDRLPGELPQWISMAYANFDNGVIRSPRPVTFLAHAESDGFSLRIIARGPPPEPPPPAQIRGSYSDHPEPQSDSLPQSSQAQNVF
jgi:hypothetical protein